MNMKKKILSAAVLATMGVGTAQAVHVSADGTGQVILFPYYTVQGNEETYLQVVNTTPFGKAVKIRFREAYNSREVLDFNIYLSPWDVWAGAVVDSGDGAGVISYDKTCTVPQLSGTAVPFRNSLFNDNNGAAELTGLERTREGYVEIIEMGAIDTTTPSVFIDANGDGHADFVHINGVPENCETLVNNWRPGGAWTTNPYAGGDFVPRWGGLFGSLSIINVASGTQVSVNALPLEGVYDTLQHFAPGDNFPTLAQAAPVSFVVYNPASVPVPAAITDNWVPSGAFAGINAVSAVLMANSVMNSYSVNPANEAESAWVVTFPTKWAYADQDESGLNAPVAPFTDTFQDRPLSKELWDNKACEEISLTAYDREEKKIVGDVDFSPAPVNRSYLCYEVNVIQFEDSTVFDSANTTFHASGMPGKNGWMSLNFVGGQQMGAVPGLSQNTSGRIYQGLPVIGFKAKVLGNGALPGAGSYASAVDHVYSRSISVTSGE